MPISLQGQVRPANNANPFYEEAKQIAALVATQFAAVRGAGAGIGPGSCCAGLAVTPFGGYLAANAVITTANYAAGAALPFAVCYGNSQMAAGGLVQGPVGGHAERAALTAAGLAGLGPWGGANHLLYIELAPCVPCQNWLAGGGGGVGNPYAAIYNPPPAATTLHVWWGWPYPGAGVVAMNVDHALPLIGAGSQLANIGGW